MFAVLTAINGGSTAPTPAASRATAGSGPPPEDTAEQIAALRETIAAGDASGEAYAAARQRALPALARDRRRAAARARRPRVRRRPRRRSARLQRARRAGDAGALGPPVRRRPRRSRAARTGSAPGVVAPYAALVDGLIETGRYGAAGQALDRMLSLKPNLASYLRASYYRELHGDLARCRGRDSPRRSRPAPGPSRARPTCARCSATSRRGAAATARPRAGLPGGAGDRPRVRRRPHRDRDAPRRSRRARAGDREPARAARLAALARRADQARRGRAGRRADGRGAPPLRPGARDREPPARRRRRHRRRA